MVNWVNRRYIFSTTDLSYLRVIFQKADTSSHKPKNNMNKNFLLYLFFGLENTKQKHIKHYKTLTEVTQAMYKVKRQRNPISYGVILR